ncbi:hypothetical protein [Phaffia rhodozyma]|uniref:Uncharacterized protein n=1 Tax=Phaffia rhodozyma TaxID=264483 RepID=A0A0F7SNB5_PHARH|nr:hypothetical protein [Phaffia rhodozyma]
MRSTKTMIEDFYARHVRPTVRLKHVLLISVFFLIGTLVSLHSTDDALSARWTGANSAPRLQQALHLQDAEHRRLAWNHGKGKSWVNVSHPQESFYQTLLPDVRYATALIQGGLSNQLVGSLELLDYAQRSGRVGVLNDFVRYPIIDDAEHPPQDRLPVVSTFLLFCFSDHDIVRSAHLLYVSNSQYQKEMIFDLARYTELTSHPSLTFRDLKNSSTTLDQLACIAPQSGILSLTNKPPVRMSEEMNMNKIQPEGVQVNVWPCPIETGSNQAISMAGLVEFSEGGWWDFYERTVTTQNGGSEFGSLNRNFVCWADMYWVTDKQDIFSRWDPNWPGWTNVGKYLRYSTHLENLKDRYTDLVLGQHAQSNLPGHQRPFIAIHARHNDFPCSDQTSATCFKSATTYLEEITRIKKVLLDEQGVVIGDQDVIMFSDEVNPHWWNEVTDVLGWKRVDHKVLNTLDSMDNWWPTLIDMAMMSSAKGFIGSKGSTYSLFASLRVQDWNDGVISIV